MEREGFVESARTETETPNDPRAPKAPFTTFAGLTRHITIAGFAGLVAGITVAGLGSRLFMRMASFIADDIAQGRTTEAGFTVGEVTFGGTIELIIFIGLFSGLLAAVFYVALFPWLAWAGPARGVAFGMLGFAATSATTDLMNPDNIDFVILKNEPIVVAMIFVLFVVFGSVFDAAYRVIDRYTPEPDRNVNAVFYTFALMGTMFVLLAAVTLFTRESCNCDPPMGVAWSMLVAAIATIALWVSVLIASSPRRLGRASTVVGYLGTAGVLIFGLIRALSDAAEIIG